MTVIAYRDGEMAADSSCMANSTHLVAMRKIWRVGGGLVGLSGDVVAMLEFLKWIKGGADEDEWPKSRGAFHAMVVSPNGRLKLFESGGPEPCSTNDRYCAIGSGGDIALGALAEGASASRAVRWAIKHCANCKPPVRSYRIKGLAQ